MKLGILGHGLIGGSIALRGRELGWDVRAHDPADANGATVADVLAHAQTLVVAAPPMATLAILDGLRTDAALVVDVASVKGPVVRAASGVPNFVATHPMAGKERGGRAGAEAGLFAGKGWMYVPSGDAALDARARAFIEAMGARPFACGAEEHDAAVARTSHLPQLLAYVLAERIEELPGELRESASGPVARELLRIAQSDRALWDEIFAANRVELRAEIEGLAAALGDWAEGGSLGMTRE